MQKKILLKKLGRIVYLMLGCLGVLAGTFFAINAANTRYVPTGCFLYVIPRGFILDFDRGNDIRLSNTSGGPFDRINISVWPAGEYTSSKEADRMAVEERNSLLDSYLNDKTRNMTISVSRTGEFKSIKGIRFFYAHYASKKRLVANCNIFTVHRGQLIEIASEFYRIDKLQNVISLRELADSIEIFTLNEDEA